MNRRVITFVAVASAAAVLATAPFYLSGARARAFVEDVLPSTLASVWPTLSIRQTEIEQGLYRSRYRLLAQVRTSAGEPIPLTFLGDARHGLAWVELDATADAAQWRALLERAGFDSEAPAPRVELRSGLFGGNGPRPSTTGTVRWPEATTTHRASGVRARSGAATLEFAAMSERANAAVTVEALDLESADGRSLSLGRFSLSVSSPSRFDAAGNPVQVRMQLSKVGLRGAGLIIDASTLALDAAIDVGPDGFRPAARLSARSITSRGVPYIALTGLASTIEGDIARALPGHPASARFTQNLESETNYGPVTLLMKVHTGVPQSPGETSWSTSDGEISLSAPRGIARLALSRRQDLEQAWRDAGLLEDRGNAVHLDLRWRRGALVTTPGG